MTLIETVAKLNNLKFHQAATGTIYLTGKGVKIRIGDHEPNYSASRELPTHEIYTHDVQGKLINTLLDVVFLLEEMGYKVPSIARALQTKEINKALKIAELRAAYDAKVQVVEKDLSSIPAIYEANKSKVDAMLLEAEQWGDMASKSCKRNTRRNNRFRQLFTDAFGVVCNYGDFKRAL